MELIRLVEEAMENINLLSGRARWYFIYEYLEWKNLEG
jgi:hypothetical protein